MVSVGTAKMIHCRRRWWWWCVQDVRLKITMHRCDVWTCMSAANACWIVLCKCMLDIKCSVLRGWSCAITKSFEFWLRTVEKMGLILIRCILFSFPFGVVARVCRPHAYNGLDHVEHTTSAALDVMPIKIPLRRLLQLGCQPASILDLAVHRCMSSI